MFSERRLRAPEPVRMLRFCGAADAERWTREQGKNISAPLNLPKINTDDVVTSWLVIGIDRESHDEIASHNKIRNGFRGKTAKEVQANEDSIDFSIDDDRPQFRGGHRERTTAGLPKGALFFGVGRVRPGSFL